MKKRLSWDRINKLIYENFKLSLRYLKEIKNYIWFSLILFFGVGIFGYLFPVFFVEEILNLIKEIIAKTGGLGGIGLVRFIFLNNLKSSFFAMLFGVFFGIVPFIVIIVNGYVLGFVANNAVASEGVFVLWRLLPHGIFELPAVLISVAVGLRLGMFLFVYRGGGKWEEFKNWLKDAFRVFLFIIVPLLVVAAIIEGILIWLWG